MPLAAAPRRPFARRRVVRALSPAEVAQRRAAASRPRRRSPLQALRDRALRALVAHPDLSWREVATLLASQVHQHGQSGYLYVELPMGAGSRLALLDAAATATLLAYLEAARLWGRSKPLFPGRDPAAPLSREGLKSALRRLEDRE